MLPVRGPRTIKYTGSDYGCCSTVKYSSVPPIAAQNFWLLYCRVK
jgi:hypothetical protein